MRIMIAAEQQQSMSTASVILVIDAGSSSIRCTVYEYSAHPTNPLIHPTSIHQSTSHSVLPNGHIQIKSILAIIDECIDEVLVKLRRRDSRVGVVAVGFSTMVMNLIGVDEWGEPVGEEATMTYACTRRNVLLECDRIRQFIGSDEMQALHQRTGAPIHPSYALPQLLAFYNSDSSCRVHRWQTISSICLHRWMGGGIMHMPISYSEASWTGLLNIRTCKWDERMIQFVEPVASNISALLPSLVDYDGSGSQETTTLLSNGIPQHRTDRTNNPYWERWPELRGRSIRDNSNPTDDPHCRLFLGIGDGAAANIGSKCSSASRIAVTIGTSAAVRVCLPLSNSNPVEIPAGLFCYRVDQWRVVLGGALTDGGSVVEWARTLLNYQSEEVFEVALKEAAEYYRRDAESSPVAVPFLSGERSTGYRGSATACLSHLTRETTPIHVLYACLEGVILRLNAILRLIRAGDECPTVLVASGKGMRNSLWRQMLADCSGCRVVLDGDAGEETSRGVALQIAGWFRNSMVEEETLSIVNESVPNPGSQERWLRAASNQEELIRSVSSTWK